VGRSAALLVVAACVVAACGQAEFAAPPSPEFSHGSRAEPTVVVDSSPTEGSDIVLSRIESDQDPVAVDQMTLVDDAGVAAPNRTGWTTFDERLSSRLVPADVAASVAVMVDGRIVHEAAFGRRIAGGDEPVETTDRFRIASISKTITAITALRLVEDGLLTLDDPIGARVTEHLGLANPDPDAASITVRELLSHTAGFPQHEGTFFSNGADSCADAAAKGLSRSVSNGNGFRYSNMSYCVLGVLIEAVTGKTYERVVDEQLLTPLGLDGMRLTSTYELGPDEVSHDPTPGRNFMEALGPAGAWNATPSDLVTILNAVDPTTPGWKALSPETLAVLRYRVATAGPPTGYGLGVINYDGGAWGHTGTLQNTHAMVLAQPDGLTWAVTVSGEYPSSTGQLRSILRDALATGFPAS
jgi:D-alanyl-D-alanine carboxypeptidase